MMAGGSGYWLRFRSLTRRHSITPVPTKNSVSEIRRCRPPSSTILIGTGLSASVRVWLPLRQKNSLGSGKWQIMPGFGVRYSFLEAGPDTYFVPVVRYAISFAGDTSRRNISEPQIAPTFNIGLPDHWFLTFYPSNDIRINFGDPISGQTGRLFLPLDVAIGRKVTDSLTISLEASAPIVNDYPVYNFKTVLRLVKKF